MLIWGIEKSLLVINQDIEYCFEKMVHNDKTFLYDSSWLFGRNRGYEILDVGQSYTYQVL